MKTKNKNKNRDAEKSRLNFTMSRIDHYYDSVNNKSAVYIAIDTFITGGVLVLITQTDKPLNGLWILPEVCLWACMALGFISLVLLAITSIPYISNKTNSIYYYGTIAKMSETEFIEKTTNCNGKKDLHDLRVQIYILSQGLISKFEKLRWVGQLLMAQFLLLIPTIIYLLTKI